MISGGKVDATHAGEWGRGVDSIEYLQIVTAVIARSITYVKEVHAHDPEQ